MSFNIFKFIRNLPWGFISLGLLAILWTVTRQLNIYWGDRHSHFDWMTPLAVTHWILGLCLVGLFIYFWWKHIGYYLALDKPSLLKTFSVIFLTLAVLYLVYTISSNSLSGLKTVFIGR